MAATEVADVARVLEVERRGVDDGEVRDGLLPEAVVEVFCVLACSR